MKCEVITDKVIDDIEVNIFKSSIQFDLERRNFIKNLDKINISAAAGCGKTTTLIAKIKILEAMQPFNKLAVIEILSNKEKYPLIYDEIADTVTYDELGEN